MVKTTKNDQTHKLCHTLRGIQFEWKKTTLRVTFTTSAFSPFAGPSMHEQLHHLGISPRLCRFSHASMCRPKRRACKVATPLPKPSHHPFPPRPSRSWRWPTVARSVNLAKSRQRCPMLLTFILVATELRMNLTSQLTETPSMPIRDGAAHSVHHPFFPRSTFSWSDQTVARTTKLA